MCPVAQHQPFAFWAPEGSVTDACRCSSRANALLEPLYKIAPIRHDQVGCIADLRVVLQMQTRGTGTHTGCIDLQKPHQLAWKSTSMSPRDSAAIAASS